MKKILNSFCLIAMIGTISSCQETPKAVDLRDSTLVIENAKDITFPSEKNKGVFAFAFSDIYVEIDANNAGRIRTFSLAGKNSLSSDKVHPTNWGTSLWPSPQSAWGWPPSLELDTKVYSGGIVNYTEVELTSEKDPKLGIVFIKNYKANNLDTSLVVTYKIKNDTENKQSLAAWEISRVAPGGLTFYPTGKGQKKNLLAGLTVDINEVTWFDYDSTKMKFTDKDVPKLIHDGTEGWLAQVNGDLILIKKFEDISPEQTAPEEGEIELYANPDKSYIEIEQQGPYTSINAKDTLNWEVKWYLRKLPIGITAQPGSKELVEFVRNTIK